MTGSASSWATGGAILIGEGPRSARVAAQAAGERIHQVNAACFEVLVIAGGDGERLRQCRGGDQAVPHRHRPAVTPHPSQQLRPTQRGSGVPRQALDPAHDLVEPPFKALTSPPVRQQQDAEPDLTQDHRIHGQEALIAP